MNLEKLKIRYLNCPNIKRAVVINKESSTGYKYLIAYYTSDQEIPSEKIAKKLEAHLPDYMIPSFFIHLDKLPLTINGKLNKKALPIPDYKYKVVNSYIGPINDIEEKICCIIENILGLESNTVNVEDDFFKLGGG